MCVLGIVGNGWRGADGCRGESDCINPYNNTRPFPDGFIETAHYRVTSDYVQISGTYNAAAMNISELFVLVIG